MPTLSLEIPNEIYSALKTTFLDDEKSVIHFVITATEEYTAWLTSQGRPSSMSDIETKRIFSIYNRILQDRVPTVWEIGEYFNLPLGRSRYIVQNLSYRYPLFMQQRKRDVLILALTNYQKREGLHSVRCPKECSEMLDAAIAEVHLEHPLNALPSKHYFTHDIVYEISNEDRTRLLDYIHKQEKKNG